MSTLLYLSHALRRHQPRKIPGRRFLRRSAVNLLIHEDRKDGLMVLMIQRAIRKGDPWSGHMAFPGGRMESADVTIQAAGLRELHEEVGIEDTDALILLGRLSDLLTKAHMARRPMVITPFVYRVDDIPETAHNHEVADSLWVPLSFLTDHRNRQVMRWRYGSMQLRLPVYYYQGKQIWGLSLSMLDELVLLLNRTAKQPKYDAEYELRTDV